MGPSSQEAYCCCSLLKPILYPSLLSLGAFAAATSAFLVQRLAESSLLGHHLPQEQAEHPLTQEAAGLSIS